MFVVSQITSQRQKNPNLLNQKDIEQLTDMIKELKEDKATISPEDQTELQTYRTRTVTLSTTTSESL